MPRVDRQSLRGAAILVTKVNNGISRRNYSSLCFKVNPFGKATRQPNTLRTRQNRTQRPKIQAACRPRTQCPSVCRLGWRSLGLPWSESKLLAAAARIDDLLHVRRMPPFANMSIEVTSAYSAVPSVTPNRSNIPNAYTVGVRGARRDFSKRFARRR